MCAEETRRKGIISYFDERYTPRRIQEKAIEYIEGNWTTQKEREIIALNASCGCLAGDTIIRYNRAKISRKNTIKYLFNMEGKSTRRKTGIRTSVRSFKHDISRIRLHPLVKVVSCGVQKVYKIILKDGKFIKATIKHEFLTKEGWKTLEDLTLQDEIMVDNLTRWAAKKERKHPKTKEYDARTCVGKLHPFAIKQNYTSTGNHDSIITMHRLVYEANLNNISIEEFRKRTKENVEGLLFVDPSIYHIHHIDGDHQNNEVSNLIALPKKEHGKIHTKGYNNFGHGEPEYSRITSITPLGEEDTYDIICEDPYRNYVANGMVVHNSGKTLIAKAIMDREAANGLRTAYITPQKNLQDQIEREFPEINILKGKDNYICGLFPPEKKISVEEADDLRICRKCALKPTCEYHIRKDKANAFPYTVFNPMSFFYFNMSPKHLPFDTIIIDESQSVVSMICSMFSFRLWRKDFKYPDGISSTLPTLVTLLEKHAKNLSQLYKESFDGMSAKERISMNRLVSSLFFSTKGLKESPEIFVVEETVEEFRRVMQPCLRVRVTQPTEYILRCFFGMASRILVMSGTLFKTDMHEMGFKDFKYLDLPSPIDKERRKFIPVCSVKNSYGNANATKEVAAEVIRIAKMHPNERGMVLTTYEQAKGLRELLNADPRFIFHDKDSKKEVIESFLEGEGKDKIAVLAGAWEGLDAKNDLCRFIIITKCMFPNLSDEVVKRKMMADKNWYPVETMKFVIQGANRATRNENDHSVTYMLDANFKMAYSRAKAYLPEYFKESIVWGKEKTDDKPVCATRRLIKKVK